MISEGVTTIGYNAFSGCEGFTGDLEIPNSVTTIGDGAFNDCNDLNNVIVKAITPPICGESILRNISLDSIQVPYDSVDTYKAAEGWNDYASIIVSQ